MNECYNIVVVVKVATAVRVGVSIREQRSRACSRRGGVSENQIAGATAARLTAVAIAIATRPFKFHEISVSNTSSSSVSSIHSFAADTYVPVGTVTYSPPQCAWIRPTYL